MGGGRSAALGRDAGVSPILAVRALRVLAVGMELVTSDGRAELLLFGAVADVDAVFDTLLGLGQGGSKGGDDGRPPAGALLCAASRVMRGFSFAGSACLATLRERWVQRDISNYEYLSELNAFAGARAIAPH